MADTRRKRTYQTDKTREKIRTAQLMNRLEAYALGEKDKQTDAPVKMDTGQVKAALGLLSKTLPDLTSADIHDSRQEDTDPLEVLARLKPMLGQEMYDKLLSMYSPSDGQSLN